jgi:hypothetical protein
MAVDAVIDLVEHLPFVEAPIGQGKSVAAAPVCAWSG